MKNFLYLFTLTIISASCAKVEKTFTWIGEREVGAAPEYLTENNIKDSK